jgi:hypothetical protein
MVKGDPTLAVPVVLKPVAFCTINVASTAVPMVVLPKSAPVGLTLRSGHAIPLTGPEHPLSFPEESTALMNATYVTPALRWAT